MKQNWQISNSQIDELLAEKFQTIQPRAGFREELLDKLERKFSPRRFNFSFAQFRNLFVIPKRVLASLIIFVLLSFTGTTTFAYLSPTVTRQNLLYPLKQGVEEIQMLVAFSPEAKIKNLQEQVDMRKREAKYLAEQGILDVKTLQSAEDSKQKAINLLTEVDDVEVRNELEKELEVNEQSEIIIEEKIKKEFEEKERVKMIYKQDNYEDSEKDISAQEAVENFEDIVGIDEDEIESNEDQIDAESKNTDVKSNLRRSRSVSGGSANPSSETPISPPELDVKEKELDVAEKEPEQEVPSAEPVCSHICDLEEKMCNQDEQILECRVSEISGCRVWQVVESCDQGFVCNNSECIFFRLAECEAGVRQCFGQQVWECTDLGSRIGWSFVFGCPHNKPCNNGDCLPSLPEGMEVYDFEWR
jgi:hypothetical protein